MEGWGDFAVITGGAAAALLGLLFVAASIRADVIGRSHVLRSRISQVLGVFLSLLIASIAIALPQPAAWALGVELLVVAVLLGVALLILDHRAKASREGGTLARILDRVNPNISTSVLLALAGIVVAIGFDAGLYLVALAALVGFVGGVTSAWLVLVSDSEV
ncbi:hypothetical protein [Leifsonia poae]|uniref:Modulator of FtsH protease n=1 Tax=Leifsonia poae TaxID=110933 RepID=A0A9W6M131_9MICO|nr:hypothetical protein [Leifsonia poae]GLJ77372.1 hypothetical protein GCM10017584_29460 [Leifsonia poae]